MLPERFWVWKLSIYEEKYGRFTQNEREYKKTFSKIRFVKKMEEVEALV